MGVEAKGQTHRWRLEESLQELALLADTAGAQVVGKMAQRLPRPVPNSYLGKGKLEELAALKTQVSYDLVIFDDELTPMQQRNIEDALQVKVIDRTALIIDIFAKRARTREGQLQVELAQHEYLLPRLAGQWSHLERLGGGIGTRGPGESQIETDRRLIRRRIRRLKEHIEEVRRHRALYRQRRKREGVPVVAIVGYTNAGKSTLFNVLSGSKVFVENKLFATLDPTTRRLALPSGEQALLTDTVGFIQKLPTTLVAAFRATLEELADADLLLHVVDITHANAIEQSQTVGDTLKDLDIEDKPILTVLNKVDMLVERPDSAAIQAKIVDYTSQVKDIGWDIVAVSATMRWGLDRLLDSVSKVLAHLRQAPANTGQVRFQ